MISEKKIQANRLNAQHSTGPRSGKGKELASGNAISHGYFAGRVLPGEDKEKFQRLLDDLNCEWHVRGSLETFYLVLIARDIWRLNRFNWGEDAYFTDRVYAEVDRRLQGGGAGSNEKEGAKIADVDAAISKFITEELASSRHMEWIRQSILRSLRQNIATLRALQHPRMAIDVDPPASGQE